MLRVAAIVFLGLLLAACGRHPDEAQLRRDVEAALAASFGHDTFKVVDFARRGSATDSTAPEGEDRRVAYYDAELELARDITLGDWDDAGAASLVTLLGAGPRSISGVRAQGNVAGDRITVHASAIYRAEGDGWAFIAPAGFNDGGRPRADAAPPARAPQQALDTLSEISRTVAAGGSRVAQNVVDQELQRSVVRIAGRLSRIEQGYPVAAGPDRGEYAAFASAFREVARSHDVRILPLITGGGGENIELLRGGSVSIALAQADTAHAAYLGRGAYADKGAFPGLRALGSLYPEFVHIVVRGDAAFKTAADLKGARIALGPERSAVRGTLMRVLAAHGLEPGRDYEALDSRYAESLPALRRGEIDAVAHVIGLPATPLRDALGAGESPLRLLPLADEAIRRLGAADDGTLPASIAAGVYPGQPGPVATVAVPALLLTTEELTRDEAVRLVRLLYGGGNDLLAQGSTQGAQVSVRMARRGLTVPLHSGAQETLLELEAATVTAAGAEQRPAIPAPDAGETSATPDAEERAASEGR